LVVLKAAHLVDAQTDRLPVDKVLPGYIFKIADDMVFRTFFKARVSLDVAMDSPYY
jgi:hypothetical protein